MGNTPYKYKLVKGYGLKASHSSVKGLMSPNLALKPKLSLTLANQKLG